MVYPETYDVIKALLMRHQNGAGLTLTREMHPETRAEVIAVLREICTAVGNSEQNAVQEKFPTGITHQTDIRPDELLLADMNR